MKSAIIIPLYNEEKTIAKVVSDINNLDINIDILIVNDNSSDRSLSKIIRSSNIVIINNKKNLGYEKTLERGFIEAIKLKYKFLITMDADGEHNISDVPKILKLLSIGNYVVVTNRQNKNRVSEKIYSNHLY